MINRIGSFGTAWFRLFLTLQVISIGLIAPVAAEEQQTAMDEVVVTGYGPKKATTATKTDTPLRDIPASVIVVPKEVLSRQGAVNMNETVYNISGVAPVMGGGYGFADNYVMRGLRMRFLRDGLSDGPTFNGYTRTMTDVERIEALKGPGSALYGRNEPGGVINLTTKKPLDVFAMELEGMAGSFNSYRSTLDLGGPLGQSFPARLNAAFYHTDGFRDLTKNITEVLPSISWRLNDKNTLTLDYDFRDIRIVPDNYGILFDSNNKLLPVNRSTKYYTPFSNTKQEIHRATLSHQAQIASRLSLRNTLLYDHRNLHLLRNALVKVNADNTITNRSLREQTDLADSFLYQSEITAGLRTWNMEHTLLGGVEYERDQNSTKRDDFDLPNITDALNPVIPETSLGALARTPKFDRTVKSDTIGIYGQEQIAFTEQIKARAGLRWDRVDFSDDGQANFPKNTSPITQRNISTVKNLLSWQVGAVYQPWKVVSFYSGVSQGKFINIQTESPNLTTSPEDSFQIEGGVKTSLWNDRLQANVAGFRTTRKNYFVTLAAGEDPRPVGEQMTDGVELDIMGSPFPGFTITANHSMYDARITSTELSGTTSIEGKKAQAVPSYSGSVWLGYEFQSGLLKGFGFGGGPYYKGKTFADALNVLEVPSFVIGNVSVSYRRPHWEAQVNVKNITNEKYFYGPTFSGANPGDPLSAYATVRFKI